MKAKGEIATWMHLFQLNSVGSRGHSAEIIVNVALRGSQADKHPLFYWAAIGLQLQSLITLQK